MKPIKRDQGNRSSSTYLECIKWEFLPLDFAFLKFSLCFQCLVWFMNLPCLPNSSRAARKACGCVQTPPLGYFDATH